MRDMLGLEEILEKLKSVYDRYDDIKVGLAGSYARGTANKKVILMLC